MKKNVTWVLGITLMLYPVRAFTQDVETIVKQHIKNNAFGYKRSDLQNFIVDNIDVSKSLQGQIVKIQQTYKGLPVYNSISTAIIKNKKITYFSDVFEKDYLSTDNNIPTLSAKNALAVVLEKLKLKNRIDYKLFAFDEHSHDKKVLVAKQRLVYYKFNGNLVLCYEFLLPEKDSPNYWDVILNATTGNVLHKSNLTSFCNMHSDAYKAENIPYFYPQNKDFYSRVPISYLNLIPADNASYNIFRLPIEAPTFGSRSIVTNPWFAASSPEGWHSDGTNHYTTTQGNNIVALSTTDSTTFNTTDGGPTRDFNFPFNDNSPTYNNINAASANLFYATNMAHDILYQFGFTETARNFQVNNFGKGGQDNDPVNALVLPIVANNANFVNFPDGTPGQMSVSLWGNFDRMSYNAPATNLSRFVQIKTAPFGPMLESAGTTGNIKKAENEYGCNSFSSGSLVNKIGLMKSGNCDDAIKVKNAQNAGAIAAVLYEESSTGNISPMTGNDSGITIPSVKILNSEGQNINNLLNNGTDVNITLQSDSIPSKEKNLAFDNVVVMHEYVHGLSNRLTGSGYNCLDENISTEQMGEGWSDFYAMMFTNKPEYTVGTSRGIGTYIINEAPSGIGVRPARYSTDFSINDYTYGRTNGMGVTDTGGNVKINQHSVGFVWATMLWDLHWRYAEKYGYSSDILANNTNGSTRVVQLITDGLKLQPCNPTFIEGRDAILAAEHAATGGVDKCMIWQAFAKRGLGVNASAGNKLDINDQVEDFTVPAECSSLSTDDLKIVHGNIKIYPNPAKNEFSIKFSNNINLGRLSVEIYDSSGKLVLSEYKISQEEPKKISTTQLRNGVYIVKVKGFNFENTLKVIIKK